MPSPWRGPHLYLLSLRGLDGPYLGLGCFVAPGSAVATVLRLGNATPECHSRCATCKG